MHRMVAALERIAPSSAPPDNWIDAPAYRWNASRAAAIEGVGATSFEQLVGIDEHKQAVRDNLERFSKGFAAHDMLLWGARGTGKSALIAAAVADIQKEQPGKLTLVEVDHTAIDAMPALFAELAGIDRAFVLLIDDLGFGRGGTDQILRLRSALEGGVSPRPSNIRIAVTSNRRAIVQRSHSEQDSPLNPRDDRDDALALADRFGLSLGFHPYARSTYLAIVESYLAPLGISYSEEDAMAWSIARGALSGRAAHQFAVECAGRAGRQLN